MGIRKQHTRRIRESPSPVTFSFSLSFSMLVHNGLSSPASFSLFPFPLSLSLPCLSVCVFIERNELPTFPRHTHPYTILWVIEPSIKPTGFLSSFTFYCIITSEQSSPLAVQYVFFFTSCLKCGKDETMGKEMGESAHGCRLGNSGWKS